MASQEGGLSPIDNRILAALPGRECRKVLAMSREISLPARHVVYEHGQSLRFLYFPVTAMISLLSVGDEDAKGIEVCTVGHEGVVGISAFSNGEIALGRAVTSLPGTAVRVELNAFKESRGRGRLLGSILRRYMMVQLVSVARAAFCHNFHKLEGRLARLLLLTHDNARADTFPLTQEFAAYLLGSHRPAVSTAANALQTAGRISYRQGKITVLDRLGLSNVACGCYSVVTREYERLLGDLLTRKS